MSCCDVEVFRGVFDELSPVKRFEVACRYSRFDISNSAAGSSPERFLLGTLSTMILSSLSTETPLHSDLPESSSWSLESDLSRMARRFSRSSLLGSIFGHRIWLIEKHQGDGGNTSHSRELGSMVP